MHLQQIHQAYPKDAVQVLFVISQPAEYVRTNYFPTFKQDLKVDYLGLDDARNDVVNRYGLKEDPRTAKNIIVDRDGIVRLIGEFTPRATLEQTLDKLLGKQGAVDLSTPEAARKALGGTDTYARWKAARALGALGDKSAVPALIAALGDASGSVRECAADALGALGDAGAGEALLARAGDSSPAVRLAVIAALGKLAHAPAAEALRKALKDEAPLIRAAAAAALGALGDKNSYDALAAAVKDQSGDVRSAALVALGGLKDPRAIPVLVDALATRPFRVMATRALVAFGQREAVEKALAAKWSASSPPGREELFNVCANLAAASLEAKAHDDGIAWCEKALALDIPSGTSLRSYLGDLYLAKGETDKALAQYDMVNASTLKEIKEGTQEAYTYNNLSWFYVQKNVRTTEALALAKKAIELAPGEANIRDTLGWAYLRNSDADNALATFGKVFASDATFASSWEGVLELAKSPPARAKVAKFCDELLSANAANEQVKGKVAEVRTELAKIKT